MSEESVTDWLRAHRSATVVVNGCATTLYARTTRQARAKARRYAAEASDTLPLAGMARPRGMEATARARSRQRGAEAMRTRAAN
mgnify:CR=1 FL=1